MDINGPIILIEDDPDDSLLLLEALDELGVENEVKIFGTASQVLFYLETTHDKPFLILSDINLPGMKGNQLKKIIDENEFLRKKSIPYIFYTTSAQPHVIEEVYDMIVQGYFTKEDSLPKIKYTIKCIVDYWKICKHPNPYLYQ
ncbi:MAG: response regulator [Chitinophagaceae bacterium]